MSCQPSPDPYLGVSWLYHLVTSTRVCLTSSAYIFELPTHTSTSNNSTNTASPTIPSNHLSIPQHSSNRASATTPHLHSSASSILSAAMSDNTNSSQAPLAGSSNAIKVDVNKNRNNGNNFNNPGRNNGGLVVQPPRREDLQPSYAQTLVGESDQGTHGWYGSMSK